MKGVTINLKTLLQLFDNNLEALSLTLDTRVDAVKNCIEGKSSLSAAKIAEKITNLYGVQASSAWQSSEIKKIKVSDFDKLSKAQRIKSNLLTILNEHFYGNIENYGKFLGCKPRKLSDALSGVISPYITRQAQSALNVKHLHKALPSELEINIDRKLQTTLVVDLNSSLLELINFLEKEMKSNPEEVSRCIDKLNRAYELAKAPD
ncbi:hypothetical protein M6C35_002039 [Vibrio metschnikovii]|nr:hypothetical protein [Vibrio metschnikovii]